MTIISQDIDGGSGTAYTTTADKQQVVVKQYVYVSGNDGIDIGDISTPGYSLDSIHNYGSISAYSIGVGLFGSSATLYNDDTGSINAYDGVFGVEDNISIMNEGTINGSSNGIYLQGNSESISNSGTISGGNAIASAGGYITVSNTGVLNGAYSAFSSSSDSATFRNSGKVVGAVKFDSGTNLYDGRGGTLNGEIYGGTGTDTFYLGNDGETERGGDGADRIYGGAGADTFVFTRLSKTDVDYVHGFDVAHDTMQLEHASFTKLSVQAPVVFANSTKATSADDHLFYNTSTGGLYYDLDGSGTKYAPTLVAHLDTGLRLTAHNFEVV